MSLKDFYAMKYPTEAEYTKILRAEASPDMFKGGKYAIASVEGLRKLKSKTTK